MLVLSRLISGSITSITGLNGRIDVNLAPAYLTDFRTPSVSSAMVGH